jgi:diacylglycerol kinase (ATP)
LNIPSYASGKNPWTSKDRFYEQSYSDGLIEILGFYTLDLALLQVLGQSGTLIAQASRVRIVTSAPLPMQVDGEPCLMEPCEICIEKRNQAHMIHNSQQWNNDGCCMIERAAPFDNTPNWCFCQTPNWCLMNHE